MIMNASEVIAQFEKLPIEEQKKVPAFFFEKMTVDSNNRPIRYVNKKSFEEAMDYVFKNYDGLLRRLAK